MWAWRVTPPAIVTRQGVIWRAEICGCDEDGGAARMAPARIISTFELEASSATLAAVE